MSADVIFQTVRNISGKLNITLKERSYVNIFIIAILLLRTFSIAYLSLMSDGDNMKTKRNKAYEFLKKKFSYTDIFRLILSEVPYKKKHIFLLLLIIHLYPVQRFFSLLFLIRKEPYRFFSVSHIPQ